MNPMAVFAIFDYGLPLAWNEDYGIIITWNGSATYNIWTEDGIGWNNVDVRTNNPNPDGHPVNMETAAAIANEVLHDVIRGE